MTDPSETNEAYERLLRAQQLYAPEERKRIQEDVEHRDRAARNRRKYPKVY